MRIKKEEDIQIWDYQMEMVPDYEKDKRMQLLTAYGNDGWECFSVTVDKDEYNTTTFYFKKPKV